MRALHGSRRAVLAALVAATACTARDAESVRRADSTSVARAATADSTPASPDKATDAAVEPVSTTPASAVEYYPAARLAQVAESLSHGARTGHTLGAHRTYQYLQIRRVMSGVPEIHDRWIDVTIVQSGRGTLLSGGRVNGGTNQGGGEHRGGTIVGGTQRPVGAGDLMVIQAGVPHQYEIARGDSLRYVTVKVLAGNS